VRDARAHGLRLISYDRPGQGMSTPRPGRVVADCAEDVQAILAQLGISRAAVWGSSVGGAYALATAALLPEAIASVCVFAPLGPYGAPGLDFTEGMSDGFREEIRVFLDDRGRARAEFQACGTESATPQPRQPIPAGSPPTSRMPPRISPPMRTTPTSRRTTAAQPLPGCAVTCSAP
jgi:pimeloyl-ACP methyl ester carboxylesterase